VTPFAVVALLLAVCPACGRHSRAVLYQGLGNGFQPPLVVDDATARRVGAHLRAKWEAIVRARGRAYPAGRWPNPAPASLRARLRRAAAADDFQIVSVKLLRPRQIAPEIVVRTTRYVAVARAAGPLIIALERGYEGFYFEARDERGIPFFVTERFVRGPHPGGGQWARSEPLFPFSHG
jgi:hypothetical protein